MPRHLLVSVSSIFDETRKDVQKLVDDLERESIQVSLLVAPHIDKKWHLAKDDKTRGWLKEQMDAGRGLILNGFDQPVQGRRAEFANLGAHEAKLRLKGATRQMEKLGFELDTFAPPRWRMSEGTLEALHKFDFRLAASTQGVHFLRTGEVVYRATCPSARASVPPGGGAETSSTPPSAAPGAATLCVCLSPAGTCRRRKSATISSPPLSPLRARA